MTGFGRSNSLSINTSGSLFGNNAGQGQQSAGLFGASSSQPQTAGGLFGSSSQPQTGGLFPPPGGASQPPQSGSLFGQQQQQQQQQQQAAQPASGSLFGNLNKPAAAGTGSSLFGSSIAGSLPQQSGGLFGTALGANAQTQTQTQNQNPGASQPGGLFSGGLGQPQKPSLFGASTQQQQQQQTNTPSLFGNTNTAQNTSTPSLFGSTQQTQPQQQQQQNTLFGGMSQSKPSFQLGGHTITGGPALASSQQAVNISGWEAVKGTTRFSDLHPNLQREIEAVDQELTKHIRSCEQVRETLPSHGDRIATVAPDVAYISQFLSTVELGLDNDSANIGYLKDLVRKAAEDATQAFRVINNMKLPAQFHYSQRSTMQTSSSTPPHPSLDSADDPSKPVDLISYFSKHTDDLGHTLDLYQRQIREIEAHLRTMEMGAKERMQQLNGSRNGVRDQRRELVDALKAIESAILEAAKKVGQTRDAVTRETLGSVGAALL
ncbi:uncharacterized protein BDR25DRAFT_266580 [Lindgomyces ingoldianus]|uniref:Uncharacterized protein n=1 Tax=Lindgomyces ingoldianus TaxID=673940 RepID=A0ACB6QL66_9PLEO|nr:uncharacterized protein BDR25DRAFT_266580 [Lindgomyces ingoldianus]KAF2467636.1 hypothetical protein BDR25DRAFT_266580 [Lindgomyces ingoldianus]